MRWFVLALALMLSGCATVETRPLGQTQASGIAYQLPLGKVRLRVTDTNGVISVLLDGPLVTGDPNQRMVAYIPQSSVSDNNVTITVDGKTNLLTKVEATSTGRLTEILTAATKSIVFLQSSEGSDGRLIFANAYDVENLGQAANDANEKLDQYYKQLCGAAIAGRNLSFSRQLSAMGHDAAEDKAATKARLLHCRALAEIGADDATGAITSQSGFIQITVTDSAAGTAAAADGGQRQVSPNDSAACKRGICYRPYRPVSVKLDVRGAFSMSDVFLVPDPNQLIYVPLPSGVTAEQKYLLEFTDGVLTKYQHDGKTELVGLLSLPFKVVEAAFSATTEGLGLKQKDIEARTSYLDAVGKLVEEQKAVSDQCAQAASAATCPKTAYKLIGGPVAPEASTDSRSAGDSDAPAAVPAAPAAPAANADGAVPVDGG
jgi:uncharacterized protein YceK